ncbi:DUF4398 domain-containing protein [bacterium]|nr:DUF4398 domain-containing protein [bacterium]
MIFAFFAIGCAAAGIRAELSAATDRVAEARRVHGDYLAVGEYEAALAYLDAARQQYRRSDYDRAREYARKATERADAAIGIASAANHDTNARRNSGAEPVESDE